jgi:hypothetical protein
MIAFGAAPPRLFENAGLFGRTHVGVHEFGFGP